MVPHISVEEERREKMANLLLVLLQDSERVAFPFVE